MSGNDVHELSESSSSPSSFKDGKGRIQAELVLAAEDGRVADTSVLSPRWKRIMWLGKVAFLLNVRRHKLHIKGVIVVVLNWNLSKNASLCEQNGGGRDHVFLAYERNDEEGILKSDARQTFRCPD